ncbi:MAG TPA: hypothetical protein PK901_12395, partial [Bacteroidia bacterium]|nr:hypothetical protein [Bacteroidia bacterium]
DYNYYIGYNSGWTSFHPTRHQVFMTKTKPGDYVGQIILMEYPPVIGNILYGEKNSIVKIENYYQIYNIGLVNYVSVIKMSNSIDIINNDQRTNYLIAKNVGIIQEELVDSNNVWKVIRYNIVQ